MRLTVDEQFLPGVYRTTTWLSGLILLVLLQTLSVPLIAGFVVGVLISVGMLRALQWAVQTAFRPDATRRQRFGALALTLGKYGALGIIFWFVLGRRLINPGVLWVGLALPQAVIFLHMVSLLLIGRFTPVGGTRNTPGRGEK